MKRLHATVSGRVQGVSFRYFTMRTAKQLGLTGWVRNRFNGSVEMIVEGNEEKLKILLEAVNLGPTSAQVSKVDHTWSEASGEFSNFKIRMTRYS